MEELFGWGTLGPLLGIPFGMESLRWSTVEILKSYKYFLKVKKANHKKPLIVDTTSRPRRYTESSEYPLLTAYECYAYYLNGLKIVMAVERNDNDLINDSELYGNGSIRDFVYTTYKKTKMGLDCECMYVFAENKDQAISEFRNFMHM